MNWQPPAPEQPAVSTENLSVILQGNLILDEVNFEIERGRLVGVMGPNGAGKSTLFDTLAGLQPKAKGKVRFFGQPLSLARGRLAYVPQHERVNWGMPVKVFDAVLHGRVRGFKLFRRPNATDRQAGEEALRLTNMWERRHELVHDLSTGQRQRVFLARALAQQADILLFDESLSGVDLQSQMHLMAVMHQLCESGKTILMVSHDLDDVVDNCDECLWVNQKVIKR